MSSRITLGRPAGTLELKCKHGIKSYEIVNKILRAVFPGRNDLVVIDLTYGVGRFYRLARRRIKTLIGVDIMAHRWEVKPDMFILDDAIVVVDKLVKGKLQIPRPDLVVVDPPWRAEKKSKPPPGIGFSSLPYYVQGVSSKALIYVALRLAEHYGVPLLYRYKEPLHCNHVVKATCELKIFRSVGAVYYGVCSPPGAPEEKEGVKGGGLQDRIG